MAEDSLKEFLKKAKSTISELAATLEGYAHEDDDPTMKAAVLAQVQDAQKFSDDIGDMILKLSFSGR